MKRTAFIDLDRMRKKPAFELTRLATLVGGAIALTGCGSDNTEARIYPSTDACKADYPEHVEVCEAAYRQAVAEAAKTAPKFRTENDCEAEFGQCVSNGNNWFMPALAGFMLANVLDDLDDRRRCPPGAYASYGGCRYSTPVFTGYGRLYGGYYGSDGTLYGKVRPGKFTTVKVDRDAFKPKPAVTRTLSRGGFGSKAAAKASWGSSRSSWGG